MPSYDVRAEIAESELRTQSAQARRVTVDEAALKVGQRVVNSCAIEFGNMGAVL